MKIILLSSAAALFAGAPLLAQATAAATATATPATYVVAKIVAVVGSTPITESDVIDEINQRRAGGLTIPTDSGEMVALERKVLGDLIDEEILVQKAKDLKIEMTEDEVNASVEAKVKEVSSRFKSDEELRQALRETAFGSLEEWKRTLAEQARRAELQRRVISKLQQDGKLFAVPVSDSEVTEAFERQKANLGPRPATIGLKQIVVAPVASAAARAAARAHIDSLLVELRQGGDFEKIAKRESMDPGTKEVGGDLGWMRRGKTVPEFDRMLFALNPGDLSPIVETSFGFHIIRVDRVQPAEVKAHHILIRPRIDSADVAAAHARADTVARLWRAGAPYDSLAAKYHDARSGEEKVLPEIERSQLPASYAAALDSAKVGDIAAPFAILDKTSGVSKFVVAQVTALTQGREYTVSDWKSRLRDQLAQEKSIRRYLDAARKASYVSIRI